MTDILKQQVGGRTKFLEVVDVQINKETSREGVEGEKAALICNFNGTHRFKVDEMLLHDRNGNLHATGLWVNTNADGSHKDTSAIARILRYYGAPTLEDLVGKTVRTLPKKSNYLALAANDEVTEEALPW